MEYLSLNMLILGKLLENILQQKKEEKKRNIRDLGNSKINPKKQIIRNKSKNLGNIKQSTTEKFKKPKAGSLKKLIQ